MADSRTPPKTPSTQPSSTQPQALCATGQQREDHGRQLQSVPQWNACLSPAGASVSAKPACQTTAAQLPLRAIEPCMAACIHHALHLLIPAAVWEARRCLGGKFPMPATVTHTHTHTLCPQWFLTQLVVGRPCSAPALHLESTTPGPAIPLDMTPVRPMRHHVPPASTRQTAAEQSRQLKQLSISNPCPLVVHMHGCDSL